MAAASANDTAVITWPGGLNGSVQAGWADGSVEARPPNRRLATLE